MSEAEAVLKLHEATTDHSHEALHARVTVLEVQLADLIARMAPSETREEVSEVTQETDEATGEVMEDAKEDTEDMGEPTTEEIQELVEEFHEEARELIYEPDTMPRPHSFLINRIRRSE